MPISKENQGGNYSKGETIHGRKLVYKRIQKGGNYSKEERNKRWETIHFLFMQKNDAILTESQLKRYKEILYNLKNKHGNPNCPS